LVAVTRFGRPRLAAGIATAVPRVSSHGTKKDGPTSLKRVNRAETSDASRVPCCGWLGWSCRASAKLAVRCPHARVR